MSAFRVLGVTSGPSRFVPRLRARLIGRDVERRLLADAFRSTATGRTCRLVTILGEPGIGKSRLAEEFASDVSASADVLRGRCLSYGEGITFLPLIDVVRQALGIGPGAPDELVRSRLGAVLEPSAADALAELLRLPDALPRPRQVFRAVHALLDALAGPRPLVLVLDDLHWAEPMLLDVIEHVAARVRSPVLVLCIARSELLERRPSWGAELPNAQRIELRPLDAVHARDLVIALLDGEAPEGLPSTIVRAADGNPLYVEELVAMLIDDEVLTRVDDGWVQARGMPQVAVPASLQVLLQARLELLTASERTVVEAGAVEGKAFHRGTVLGLAEGDLAEDDLDRALEHLSARDFIRPDRSVLAGERAFRFRHQLIRDVAYGRVPKARRAALHEALADLWETQGRRLPEPEAILGYHLEQAYRLRAELGTTGVELDALGARAASKLASAGRLAGDRGDDAAAVNLLERACALLPASSRDRAGVLLEASDLLLWAYRFSEARAVADEAAAIASSIGEPALEVQAECVRAMALLFLEEHFPVSDLREVCRKAEAVLEAFGDEVGLARVLLVRSQVHEADCRFGEEVIELRRTVALADRNALRRTSAIARYLLAGAYAVGPTPCDEALDRCRELLDEDPGNPLVGFGVTWRMSFLEAMRGRSKAARRLLDQAMELGEATALEGPLRNLAYWRGGLAWAEGDLGAAERWSRRTLDTAQAEASLQLAGTMANVLAQILIEQDRLGEVEPLVAIADRTLAEDDVGQGIWLRIGRSAVAASHGDVAGAEVEAREAMVLARQTESPMLQGDALSALGRALLARGHRDEAAAAFHEAVAAFERKGMVHRVATARGELACLP